MARYLAIVTGIRPGFGEKFVVEGDDAYEAAHAAWTQYKLPDRPYVEQTGESSFRVYTERRIEVIGSLVRVLDHGKSIHVRLSQEESV